jgi:arsenate reductase (thioredoxin)
MAEGWTRQLKGEQIDAFSAGADPTGLDPRAVAVMAEAGVDISDQQSKSVAAFVRVPLDVVVTVCDSAREACPVFPGKVRLVHVGFEDPPALARGDASEEEILFGYRRVRDEIRRFVETLPAALKAR